MDLTHLELEEEQSFPNCQHDYIAKIERAPPRGSNRRRRPLQVRSFDSDEDHRSKDRRSLKPRRVVFAVYRWRIIKALKTFQWAKSAPSLSNLAALLVLFSSLVVILSRSTSITTPSKEETTSLNVSFPKTRRTGSTFHRPGNSFTSTIPNYAGITLDTLDPENFHREIKETPPKPPSQSSSTGNHIQSQYHRHRQEQESTDDSTETDECEPVEWQTTFYLNCNNFHELDEANAGSSSGSSSKRHAARHLKYLGSGHYRAAWLVHQEAADETLVLKQLRMPEDDDDTDHTVNRSSLAKVQKDAIVMERLTASPYIVDAFGLCGTSIFSEVMPNEVADLIIPGDGYAEQEELDGQPSVVSGNNYTIAEKLDMAIDMTQALAAIHGFKEGVILHGDVHPVQWLRSPEGFLKLNDFNGAEILPWNPKEQRSCKTNRGRWGGNYRSPEEYRGDDIDEKVDVYSMGNNLYTLMTGFWPFYEEHSYSPVIRKVKKRERPYIDDRWKTHSNVEAKFVELMGQMWEHKPEDRPDIFAVLQVLLNVKKLEEAKPKEKAEPEKVEEKAKQNAKETEATKTASNEKRRLRRA